MNLNDHLGKRLSMLLTRIPLILAGVAILAAPLVSQAADRMAGGLSGKQVVEKVCAGCHATGAKGAPRIGDQAAWRARASQGLTGLTQHALEGIRQMPGHGGHPELTDLEIARAITYMVNQSGGHWVEPIDVGELPKERSGKEVVEMQCVRCHGTGVGGAPKIGDKSAWVARLKHGLEYTVRSAINGHGGMPARGGLASLTDSEIQNAILYMFNPSGTGAAEDKSAGAAMPVRPAPPQSNQATVGGMVIYLGLVPAEHILTYPAESPERSMHGGVPRGPDYYYVNVSLADRVSHAPIAGARVDIEVQEAGLSSESERLQPMPGGPGSYGNYVRMKKNTLYVVTVQVRSAETVGTTKARFEYQLP
jgi:cytochrome c5